MSKPVRSSDIVEGHSEKALSFGIGGIVALGLGALMIYYQGMLMYLGYILALGGIAAIIYAIYCAMQVRKVPTVSLVCPYCSSKNTLTAQPEVDFSCTSCHRLIPVQDGKMLPVFQVRCGFCNHLNYYSPKSIGLICEECDREIPIANEAKQGEKFFAQYTHHDDDKLYELVLVGQGHKTEELIQCLQHMLALNRNQVKDMLAAMPVTLLTGIPRKKAEMLSAQLALHDGKAEFTALS